MASSTSKLHMALAAVLLLALVVAAAAGTCQPEAKLKAKACANQIIEHHEQTKEVFTPACCNELAGGPLGCACFVRDLILAADIDIKKPFCGDDSGCPNYRV